MWTRIIKELFCGKRIVCCKYLLCLADETSIMESFEMSEGVRDERGDMNTKTDSHENLEEKEEEEGES